VDSNGEFFSWAFLNLHCVYVQFHTVLFSPLFCHTSSVVLTFSFFFLLFSVGGGAEMLPPSFSLLTHQELAELHRVPWRPCCPLTLTPPTHYNHLLLRFSPHTFHPVLVGNHPFPHWSFPMENVDDCISDYSSRRPLRPRVYLQPGNGLTEFFPTHLWGHPTEFQANRLQYDDFHHPPAQAFLLAPPPPPLSLTDPHHRS